MARILVVDDDPDILKLAQKVLGSQGHMTFTAGDALKAIEYLNENSFDLLISDANMPRYSGFELVRTIKKDTRFKHMGIAMLTGLRERKDIEKAIQAGVDDYIVKPIDPLLFLQKITALFNKRPPADYPEIRLNPDSSLAKAQILLPVHLESVSELGVTILTDQEIKEGATLEVASEFFKDLDIPPPLARAFSVVKDGGKYRAQLMFLGARESMLQKIRAWIFSHASSYKNVS